jgi:citrate lyase beta subunit
MSEGQTTFSKITVIPALVITFSHRFTCHSSLIRYTMPPHERFSTNLLETLASSRLKLIDYVERKKSEVDQDVEEYNKTLAHEEEQIQAQKETLKAVQSERGLSSEEGISQRREQLSLNKILLEERVRALQEEARKQELTVEGE